jgi:hypothetical protein
VFRCNKYPWDKGAKTPRLLDGVNFYIDSVEYFIIHILGMILRGAGMTNSEDSWHSVTLSETLDEVAFLNVLLVCGQRLRLSRPTGDANDRTIQVYCEDPEALASAKALLDQASADAQLRQQIQAHCAHNIAELTKAILNQACQPR